MNIKEIALDKIKRDWTDISKLSIMELEEINERIFINSTYSMGSRMWLPEPSCVLQVTFSYCSEIALLI